ncbi:putative endonuclease lcl3 [Modicella reniformis]|uniref:Endonuclease lcl3 n=1 Tax=Modicella reniformis TaxID=1440133 RepID=A0A9P6LY02_9FUNG|nr:putative endonuclease lcl3 [Modicella reniformis]
MVWLFTSKTPSSSDNSSIASSTLDAMEHARSSAEEMTAAAAATPSSSSLVKLASIPASLMPFLTAAAVFGVSTAAVIFYRTRLRRIPSVAYLTPNMLQGRRVLKGKVTSVGDSDNFRFYHTPGGIWTGWGWLRHVPIGTKELKNQTLHVRLAGVDAPEATSLTDPSSLELAFGDLEQGAHFGMPAQPFSQESLAWLRSQLNGQTVLVKPYTKDRYDRVVSMVWYPRALPFLPKKNANVEVLKVGYAQIYRQAGSEYGGMLQQFEALEAEAKKHKLGIWSQKKVVSAAEHKKQHLRGGG